MIRQRTRTLNAREKSFKSESLEIKNAVLIIRETDFIVYINYSFGKFNSILLVYLVQNCYLKNVKKKHCRDPGLFRAHVSSPNLNQGPSDLQSDALPTELSRQLHDR